MMRVTCVRLSDVYYSSRASCRYLSYIPQKIPISRERDMYCREKKTLQQKRTKKKNIIRTCSRIGCIFYNECDLDKSIFDKNRQKHIRVYCVRRLNKDEISVIFTLKYQDVAQIQC